MPDREQKPYNRLSVIDPEIAPMYLQQGILMSEVKCFDRNVPQVERGERGILPK